MLLAYEIDKHIIPVDYIESFKNNNFTESCHKLDDCKDIVYENDIFKYARYKDKPREEINKDLAFLSLALFSIASIISITATTMVIVTIKYSVGEDGLLNEAIEKYTIDKPLGVLTNTDLNITDARVQGKYIVLDVNESSDGVCYCYNYLINLKEQVMKVANILYHIDKPVMLMNTGTKIELVNSNTFKSLHPIVKADLTEVLYCALDSELGMIYVLKLQLPDNKFRYNFVLGLEDDVLLLSKVFTEDEFSIFYNNLLETGVLPLENEQQVICTRQYSCKDFILNNVRRS